MILLKKYLSKTILRAILLFLLIISIIQFFIFMLDEIRAMGGNYNFHLALEYVLLRLPLVVATNMPQILLLGTLVGLSTLASSHELVVIRASGISIFEIFKILANIGFFVIVIFMFFTEVFFIQMTGKAEILKYAAQHEGQIFQQNSSLWFKTENDFWFIGQLDSPSLLKEVSLFKRDKNNEIKSISFFKELNWINGQWHTNALKKIILKKDRVFLRSENKFKKINLSLDKVFFKNVSFSTKQPNLYHLIRKILLLKKTQNVSMDELEFFQRLFLPFNSLLMMMLAIPCVFGSLRSSTMGSKLIIGIFLGFGFYFMNRILGYVAIIYQIPAFVGVSIPFVVFSIFGIFLLRKMV